MLVLECPRRHFPQGSTMRRAQATRARVRARAHAYENPGWHPGAKDASKIVTNLCFDP